MLVLTFSNSIVLILFAAVLFYLENSVLATLNSLADVILSLGL